MITLQSDQKILVGGSFNGFTPNGGTRVARTNMARLNTDGTVDTTFDPQPNGAVLTQVVQADGKIVAAGKSGAKFALARYGTDGTLDTVFGTGGKVTTAISTTTADAIDAVVIQPDGRIVAAGYTRGSNKISFYLLCFALAQ